MIVDRKITVNPDGTIVLRNTVDPSALLAQIHEIRQERAKEGGKAALGFSADGFSRHVGQITPSIMLSHPLTREALRAEMAGDQDYADRLYKLFFNTNPLFRTSLGQI